MPDLRQQETARPAAARRSRSRSSAGAKLVMTSGGYRSVSSRATVARFRKHVSPLTGVVTKLERIEGRSADEHQLPCAQHNFSAPATNVDQLREGLTGGSFGKGSTAEQAEASALMESIERYSGIFQGDEIRMTRRFTDFAAGRRHPPNDVLLFSEAQFARRASAEPGRRACRARSLRSQRQDRMVAGLVAARRTLQIFADQPAVFLLRGPALPCRFQRLRRRQHARGSHRPGLSRTGGARCLRDLVVQPLAARRSRSRRSSTIPMSATSQASLPTPAASCGCSTSPAISACRPMSRSCTGCRTARKISSSAPARISIAASRCCASLTELNQFLSIGLMDGGGRREAEPRRRHAAFARGLSVPDAGKNPLQPPRRPGLRRSTPRARRSKPASR